MTLEHKTEKRTKLHNIETLLRVMEPQYRDEAIEMLRAVADGKTPGAIIIMGQHDGEQTEQGETVTMEGMFYMSRVAPAALVRLMAENLHLKSSDLVRCMEDTETRGEIIER